MPGLLRTTIAIVAAFLLLIAPTARAAENADTLYAEAIEQYRAGKYDDGADLARRALELREKSLGPNDVAVAKALDLLAALYMAQKRRADAEPLFKRSLSIFETTLGAEHPDVATSHCNFGAWFEAEGRDWEAKSRYERCLAIREKALGADHLEVAMALEKLALLYGKNEDWFDDDEELPETSESLFKRCLSIREKALGPDHPDVAVTRNNLAGLYHRQKRYAEAEPLLIRGLAIREKTPGPDHLDLVDLALALHNLGALYTSQKRFADAEPLFVRSLAIRTKALGRDHPLVVEARDTLAMVLSAQGRFDDAQRVRQGKLAPPVEPDQSPNAGANGSAWLGAKIQNMDAATAQSLGWASPRGAVIKELLANSPAAGSGLIVGDAIVAVDDHLIAEAQDLTKAIGTYRPNAKVVIHVYRFGSQVKVPVTLGAVPKTAEKK